MSKTVLAELVTRMTVESEQFKKELEKTTARTVAHGKASQKAANDSKFLDKGLKANAQSALALGKRMAGAAVAVAAVGAAAYAAAKRIGNQAIELDKLAKLSGTSVENFQALAFATKTVGIEQDKFADIAKDTREKLGEFLATGGGGFKDFFEQVAPKVDLTAESLRNLSGPEVLQAVKNAMDQANISAKEQVFYFESIASDAAALIPLLAGNGKELDRLTTKFNDLGAAMSQADVDQAKKMAENMAEWEAAAAGLGNTLSLQVLPALTSVAGFIDDKLTTSLNNIRGLFALTAAGFSKVMGFAAQMDEYTALASGDYVGAARYGAQANQMQKDADTWVKVAADYWSAVDKLNGAGRKDAPITQTNNIFEGLDTFNAPNSINSALIEKGRADGQAYIDAVSQSLQSNENMDAFNQSLFDTFNNVESFDFSTLTAAQDQEAAIRFAHYQRLEDMAAQHAEMQAFYAEQAEANWQQNVVGMAANIAGQIAAMAEEGSAMAKVAFAAQQSLAIAMTIMNTEMAAAAALAPPPIGMGPIAGVPYSQVIRALGYTSAGIIAGQTIASFDGGGFTGWGPRTGGEDGKGGFWAMLHPQETVIDHTKGQRLPVQTQQDAPVNISISYMQPGQEQHNRRRLVRDVSYAVQQGRRI